MPESLPKHEVEDFVIQARADGNGFVMDLANEKQEAIRLEFPSWMLHQLMRVLPKLDAALHQPSDEATLLAYPVSAWRIEREDLGPGVIMRMRDNREVESALHFALADAQAFHRQLGEAIAKLVQLNSQTSAASKLN